jgi:hypothetical protein
MTPGIAVYAAGKVRKCSVGKIFVDLSDLMSIYSTSEV